MEYIIAVTNFVDAPNCNHITVIEGVEEFSYPSAIWAIFEANGELPEATQRVYKQFYTEWLPNSGYDLADLPVIECYMQENKKFYINALNTPGQNSFSEYLIQFTHEIILSLISELYGNKTLNKEELEFIADFYSFAFVGVILKWAKHGMKENPKQYADKINELINIKVLNERTPAE